MAWRNTPTSAKAAASKPSSPFSNSTSRPPFARRRGEVADSVGIGCYRIDLHPARSQNYIDVGSWPFQIPLGSLIPQRVANLLPACKNLGVTHITNGCYRLHPVSGTSAKAPAPSPHTACKTISLRAACATNENQLKDFQRVLEAQGVETRLADDLQRVTLEVNLPL
jgi:hypothetical protein